MKRTPTILLVFLLLPLLASGQKAPKDKGLETITANSILGPMEFLASDWMMGRETGTAGEFMAADYIASIYKTMGLKPGGSKNSFRPTYFQDINFIQTRPGQRQECGIVRKDLNARNETQLEYKVDYSINPGSQSIETEAQVIFVGYGIEDQKLKQHDYKGLDIKGKILIRLSGYPGWKYPDSKNYSRFPSADAAALRQLELNKDIAALSRGALAVIEIRSGSAGFSPAASNLPYRYNSANYEGDEPFNTEVRYRTALQGQSGPGLTRISLSDRALNLLTEGSGIDFTAYELQAANETIKPIVLPADRFLRFVSSVESRINRCSGG